MAETWTTITNNVPRDIVDAWELTDKERAEFDYLDWPAIERGEASATFVRYRGVTYDLGDFQTTYGLPDDSPLRAWSGFQSDTFFSATVVRWVGDDCEQVVMGRIYT